MSGTQDIDTPNCSSDDVLFRVGPDGTVGIQIKLRRDAMICDIRSLAHFDDPTKHTKAHRVMGTTTVWDENYVGPWILVGMEVIRSFF